jgi:glycosyltransferase involved in cell wall biosynthesis
MAAMEAMSFGKPVMCYLLPQVFEAGLPQECPIVNTNPVNLKEQLIKLINNPKLRESIGMAGRAYVEKYHDAEIISTQ